MKKSKFGHRKIRICMDTLFVFSKSIVKLSNFCYLELSFIMGFLMIILFSNLILILVIIYIRGLGTKIFLFLYTKKKNQCLLLIFNFNMANVFVFCYLMSHAFVSQK